MRKNMREEEINKIRLQWCRRYFFLGFLSIMLFLIIRFPAVIDFLKSQWIELFWCVGWTAIGIGVGLCNSRTEKGNFKIQGCQQSILESHSHYYTFFFFVWFIGTVAAFIALKYSYPISCLTAIVIGILGDSLIRRIGDFIKFKG